jgi:hypothetical protein
MFEPLNGFVEDEKAEQCRTNQNQESTHCFELVRLICPGNAKKQSNLPFSPNQTGNYLANRHLKTN